LTNTVLGLITQWNNMVTLVKHEWHQTDRQYAVELDEALLSEIYPDLDEDEIKAKLNDLDIEEVLQDAYDNDVEIEWDFQFDDCWTDRKGGYEVTYELGDASSWTEPQKEPEPTHKCTKCKWEGSEYDSEWKWVDNDGNELEDAVKVCKYCESDIILTDAGIQKEKETAERIAQWALDDDFDEEEVPCFSCDELVKESDLLVLSGQYFCPHCREGWVMPDDRSEDIKDDEDTEDVDCD